MVGCCGSVRLDGVANGVGMNAQFAGNGADFPMLGVKVAANLRAGFRADHERTHLRRGMRGNGSMKRPMRPQIQQRSHKADLFRLAHENRRHVQRCFYCVVPRSHIGMMPGK